MTMTKMIGTLCVLFAAGLTVGCGGGDDGGPANNGNPTADAGTDTGTEAATGPWECRLKEGNVAIWKETGDRVSCGGYRCHPEDGCGNVATEPCKSDERCISNTAEAGAPPDQAMEVHCINGQCLAVPK